MARTRPPAAGKSFTDLGRLQREVMAVVWEFGEATVHQVRTRLGRRRPRAYTTVLSAMQKLEKAGWLKHRTEGRTYVYRPSRSWESESKVSLRRLLHLVFRGDRRLLLQQLLDAELTSEELAELHALVRRRRREGADG